MLLGGKVIGRCEAVITTEVRKGSYFWGRGKEVPLGQSTERLVDLGADFPEWSPYKNSLCICLLWFSVSVSSII